MSLSLLLAALRRRRRVEAVRTDPAQVAALAARFAADGRTRPGRRLAVFAVPLGGCGACAAELDAALGPAGVASSLGIVRAAAPAAADVLAITGIGTRAALAVLGRVRAAAGPVVVVAVGDCAATGLLCGGFEAAGYTVAETDGVRGALAVDLAIRGAPPPPGQILLGLATVLEALSSGKCDALRPAGASGPGPR